MPKPIQVRIKRSAKMYYSSYPRIHKKAIRIIREVLEQLELNREWLRQGYKYTAKTGKWCDGTYFRYHPKHIMFERACHFCIHFKWVSIFMYPCGYCPINRHIIHSRGCLSIFLLFKNKPTITNMTILIKSCTGLLKWLEGK